MAFEPTPRELVNSEQRTDSEALAKMLGTILIVASSNDRTIEAVAKMFDLDEEDIYGDDPEIAVVGRQARTAEPLSDDPRIPVLFKTQRLDRYFKDVFIEDERKKPTTGYIETAPSLIGTQYHLEFFFLRELLEKITQERAQQYANEHPILASDIVVKINGETVHRPIRDNKRTYFEVEQSEMMSLIFSQLKDRHAESVEVEWDCAFSFRVDGVTKIARVQVSTTVPPILEEDRQEVLLEYFDPYVSGGVKLVELMDLFPEQPFYVQNYGDTKERAEISREDAECLIVKKVLTLNMYSELINNESQSEAIDGALIGYPAEIIHYEFVPLTLAQFHWLNQQ